MVEQSKIPGDYICYRAGVLVVEEGLDCGVILCEECCDVCNVVCIALLK